MVKMRKVVTHVFDSLEEADNYIDSITDQMELLGFAPIYIKVQGFTESKFRVEWEDDDGRKMTHELYSTKFLVIAEFEVVDDGRLGTHGVSQSRGGRTAHSSLRS